MTAKNLIFLTICYTAIILFCILWPQYRTEPQNIETPEEPPLMAEAEPEPAPLPKWWPVEPIHDESYIRYELTDEERAMVERVVAAESRNQHINGQIAIAQCVLNTAEAENMRPDEVVLQPNQYASPVSYDYVTDSVRQAVGAVFDYGITITDEPIRFFYAPKYSSGRWHEANLEYVITIEDHKFFKIPD